MSARAWLVAHPGQQRLSNDHSPEPSLPHSALVDRTMFQPVAKAGFTIESLVAKDGGTGRIVGSVGVRALIRCGNL